MLDIEALGPAPNGVILSIGAVKFDRQTWEPLDGGSIELRVLSETQPDRVVSARTAEWWMSQSDEARLAVLTGRRVSLSSALSQLEKWFLADPRPSSVWSHSFDKEMMNHAFAHAIRRPWRANQWRDITTLMGIAVESGFDMSSMGSIPREGDHICVEDCLYQIRYCGQAMRAIKNIGKG